ncbi:MAG: Crp/Fnr family transcriptional regulator [Anaerolineales bacterium]|nr:Crp/Fnr family transcriptional regulator [Anaerolineales bacterium]
MYPSLTDLRRVNVFQQASDADLESLRQHSLVRAIEEKSFFFLQGDEAAYLYVLTSGRAKIVQSNVNGQQVTLRIIYPWQVFGALGAVSNQVALYPASAQALENSVGLAIESAFFRKLMASDSHLAFGMMNLMTAYIQEIQERYRELALERVEQRVASALIRLAGQAGVKSETEAGIELVFSRQDVAELTGATLYTISRLLSDWERKSIIQSGRERIRILRPHELVTIASTSA